MDHITRDIIRHSLGLSRATRPYRNHFCASFDTHDFATCTAAVKDGYMEPGRTHEHSQFFHVTQKGAAAVGTKLPK